MRGKQVGVSNRRSNEGGSERCRVDAADPDGRRSTVGQHGRARLVDPCCPSSEVGVTIWCTSPCCCRMPVMFSRSTSGRLRAIAEASSGDLQDLVDGMPRVLEAASIGGGWSLSPDAPATTASARQAVEGAADGLMPAHAELARLDPRSPEAVRDTLRELEVQVSMVSERRELVERRVREVQALLAEQYKRGEADPDDWRPLRPLLNGCAEAISAANSPRVSSPIERRGVEAHPIDVSSEAAGDVGSHLLGRADGGESSEHAVIDQSRHLFPSSRLGKGVELGLEALPTLGLEHRTVGRS